VSRVPPSAPARDPLVARCAALVERGPHLSAIQDAVTEIRDEPALLRTSIAALSGDEKALAEVGARSSVHPNGFAKVILHRGQGWSIRLHVWPSDRAVEDVEPHGHRWVFASWIIAGVLREITFAESSLGEEFECCEYGRDSSGAYLRPVGRARLVAVRTIDRPVGTVYSRMRSVLHTAEPYGSGLVASLVLQGRAFGSTPVYVRPDTPSDHQEQELGPDELRSLLDQVSAALR
jgi:hypothetical protein